MNVYDFDGTIYHPDCSIDFAFWCMNRRPALYITFFPRALANLIRYKLGKMPRHLMMRHFFSFLMKIEDYDVQIERFWDKHENRISAWYLAQKRPDDLIISASPTCVMEPIARRLGVRVIATEYDREYGVFLNNLMAAKEKASLRKGTNTTAAVISSEKTSVSHSQRFCVFSEASETRRERMLKAWKISVMLSVRKAMVMPSSDCAIAQVPVVMRMAVK